MEGIIEGHAISKHKVEQRQEQQMVTRQSSEEKIMGVAQRSQRIPLIQNGGSSGGILSPEICKINSSMLDT